MSLNGLLERQDANQNRVLKRLHTLSTFHRNSHEILVHLIPSQFSFHQLSSYNYMHTLQIIIIQHTVSKHHLISIHTNVIHLKQRRKHNPAMNFA